MSYFSETMGNLLHQTAFFNLTWGNFVMIIVACFFLYLAIAKGFEPLLLVPIAFGMLLVNIYPDIMANPEDMSNGVGGLLHYFYILDEWSILPSLIFMGVGAMTDFGPLIANPKSFLLGAAAQFGIFAAYFGAIWLGFNDKAAAAYVGTVIAKRALEKGIKEVVFDRGGFIYQGKIQALADAAREAGLVF